MGQGMQGYGSAFLVLGTAPAPPTEAPSRAPNEARRKRGKSFPVTKPTQAIALPAQHSGHYHSWCN